MPVTLFLSVTAVSLATGRQSEGLDHPLCGALSLAALLVLPVALLLRRWPDWRAQVSLTRAPWAPTVLGAMTGVVGAWALNGVLSAVSFAVQGNMAQVAADKAKWLARLEGLPVWVMLSLALLAGVWEEFVFRGFVLGRFTRAFTAWLGAPRGQALALGLSSLLFGLGHGYQGLFGVMQTTAVGLVFGAVVLRRQSLWPAMLAHVTLDTISLLALKVLGPLLHQVK